MILKRFYDDKLAQASYLVGCAATGEACVVDPNRDVQAYLDAAEAEGLRVTHVTETHIHADFVSGARELAQRAGAALYLSDEGDETWKYAFAAEAGAVLVRDGDEFSVGNVRFRVMHTPGHTPEHVSFVVTDTAGADRPMGVFTGDFVFVGDVGRPDLLERAAHYEGTMRAGASTLFRSLQRFRAELPEYVQIWPGHGAGSACGKALGAVPFSTVGYETRFNWGLAHTDEAAFVQDVLAGQPEPPMYFAEMKRLNRDGPRILGGLPRPERLPDARLEAVLVEGATLVDTRDRGDFARAHVPGALSVPPGRSFTTWAGSVVPYERPFFLVAADAAAAAEAARDLAMIGLDLVGGWFPAAAVDAWIERHGRAGTVPDVSADAMEVARGAGEMEVLDVRNSSEYAAGHIPGSVNVPLGRLAERLDEVPRGVKLAVHCLSGARSAVAISLLKAEGFGEVVHLEGDYAGWTDDGRPVEREDAGVPA
jgi:hydroxyacylglutathione hydrolase